MRPLRAAEVLRSVARFLPLPPQRAHGTAAAAPRAATGLDSAVLVYGALSSATAGLCLWQLYRYDWKLSILAERRALLQAPSVDISRGP